MEPKQFEKYLKLCRKYGIDQLKIADIEVKLSNFDPNLKTSSNEAFKGSSPYSDDAALYWSVGGIPPINDKADDA